MQHHDLVIAKLVAFMPKALGAIVGGVLALVLSGDIDRDGKLQLSKTVLIKIAVSAAIGAFVGQIIIEYFGWDDSLSLTAQGGVMMIASAFGLLCLGIVYQSIALSEGKPLPEVITDIKASFKAIFK